MNCCDLFAISYPFIKHPLGEEKIAVKIKYICLLECYRSKFCPESAPAQARFEQFKQDFLKDTKINGIDVDHATKEIMKTRFTPFRLFSFRYVFLFDCIFLLSPSDIALSKKICEEMKSTVHHRYHKRLDLLVQTMFDEASAYPENCLITKEQYQSWINTQQFLSTEKKNVLFTATMSAGKSTLINAIIGQELSFAKKAACTAAVMEFCPSPVYHRQYNILSNGTTYTNVSSEAVKKFTQGRETPCTVFGYFNAVINEHPLSIYDTPGVNSSQNPKHKAVTRQALLNGTYDVIVYVIPVESYGSEDDFFHLQFIKQKASYKKILFVINMMDTCDFEDDKMSEIVENISAHLKEIGFEQPIICPLSAKAGFLFKRALTGNVLSENETKAMAAFYSKFQEPEYDLSLCYSNAPSNKLHCEKYQFEQIDRDDLYRTYLHTGLPQFELTLSEALKEV